MKLKANIAASESGLLFNPGTGDSFAANPVAAELLRLLQQERSLAELKAHLLSRYEVEPRQLEHDCDDFLTQLRQHHLLD